MNRLGLEDVGEAGSQSYIYLKELMDEMGKLLANHEHWLYQQQTAGMM